MSTKHILHYGLLAGISYYYSLSLRNLGINSVNVVPSNDDSNALDPGDSNRQLPYNRALYPPTAPRFIKYIRRFNLCFQVLQNCSLIHFYCKSIFRGYESQIFHHAGIPQIISWAGSDARIISIARKNNPYFYMMPDEARDIETRRRLARLSKGIRYVATDPEIAEYCLPYFEKVFYIPQPIDLNDIVYQLPQKSSRPPVVMHIPTRREVKGTAYIEAAVERLQSEGYSLDFQVFKPVYTQKQVREMIATADIYIDELRCGSYGMTAVEAMASGKPTITYIREDLLEKYPANLPLVNTNPDTIYEKLKELILDADLRHEIGKKGREYVEKYHSLEVIAPRLVEIYQEIGWKG